MRKTWFLLPSVEKQPGCLKALHLQGKRLRAVAISFERSSFPPVKLLQGACGLLFAVEVDYVSYTSFRCCQTWALLCD